jgi:hypothetical protein
MLRRRGRDVKRPGVFEFGNADTTGGPGKSTPCGQTIPARPASAREATMCRMKA